MRARVSTWQWMVVVLIAPLCLGASCRRDVQDAAESGALSFVSGTTSSFLEAVLMTDERFAN